ncbi:hypothetical protein MJG53_000282 [Ovis ammon polii x Ovis aries]|nr:hypothetical protein MJG53_000282 [Ovis ammon polii x Ovis aries]
MSALERNPQVPALSSHKVLGPGISGRGIPKGPRGTRMGDWPFLRPPERVPESPVGKNSRRPVASQEEALSTGKARGTPGSCSPFQESPRCVSPFQRNRFSLHCLDVQAEDRLPPRVHVGQPCGKASWESLVGKTRGKTIDALIHGADCVTLLLPLWRKAQVHARIRDEGLTPLGRLQKYPKIHVSTGEEPSGSGPEFTQGLRPRHQRERNSERPPWNSHGDWPFLRPPERVPEGPVVSREHLPQLEKIQEVLPSRRDEAHFR